MMLKKGNQVKILTGKDKGKTGEVIDLGVEYGVVNKSGSWFSYGDTKLGQGRDAVKRLLLDNLELADEIESKIVEQIQTSWFTF